MKRLSVATVLPTTMRVPWYHHNVSSKMASRSQVVCFDLHRFHYPDTVSCADSTASPYKHQNFKPYLAGCEAYYLKLHLPWNALILVRLIYGDIFVWDNWFGQHLLPYVIHCSHRCKSSLLTVTISPSAGYVEHQEIRNQFILNATHELTYAFASLSD